MREAVLTLFRDVIDELSLEELGEIEQLLSEAILARMAHPPTDTGWTIIHEILDVPRGEKNGY